MQAAVDEALSLAREDFTVQRATMFGTGRGYEALYIQMALAARVGFSQAMILRIIARVWCCSF